MIVHRAVDKDPLALPELFGSGQAALRHPELAVYRCFLPDLTGFTGLRRVEPGLQRRIARADSAGPGLERGIPPRYSGLRVQGTASSPPSTITPSVPWFIARCPRVV